jgi:hypothetical protein
VPGFFRAKALRFDANDDDACGYRNPLEGAVVATFAALGLQVKTLDLVVSTTVACASLPSCGRCHGAPILLGLVSVALVVSLGSSCLYLFIFYLLCKRFSTSPCISLAVCGFIYKAGRKPVSRWLYKSIAGGGSGGKLARRNFSVQIFHGGYGVPTDQELKLGIYRVGREFYGVH